jgi:acetoin utilization deacetylase AcuC-like enzyme
MLTVIASDRFAAHQNPPGHPERVERAEVMEIVASKWSARGGAIVAPHTATTEQLTRIHTQEYISRIAETAGRAVALDPDTYTSAESHGVALLAAGAGIDAVERVLGESSGVDDRRERPSGRPQPIRRPEPNAVLAMVRPPGHHAERSRAMGFCLFNNIAVAAAHARTRGAARVAIVDYDVHHGNGTQHIFETDPNVLYISLHQFPFYPGTGAADEIGSGDGAGFTVNLPLEVGAVDADYEIAFTEVVVPVLMQYKPDLLLVSAGFDAHERDPLAGMRLTTGAFGAMTSDLAKVAQDCCEGRIVLMTEGGYDLTALAQSLESAIGALSPASSPVSWPTDSLPSTRGRTTVNLVKPVLAPFWKL